MNSVSFLVRMRIVVLPPSVIWWMINDVTQHLKNFSRTTKRIKAKQESKLNERTLVRTIGCAGAPVASGLVSQRCNLQPWVEKMKIEFQGTVHQNPNSKIWLKICIQHCWSLGDEILLILWGVVVPWLHLLKNVINVRRSCKTVNIICRTPSQLALQNKKKKLKKIPRCRRKWWPRNSKHSGCPCKTAATFVRPLTFDWPCFYTQTFYQLSIVDCV